ncbi:MAG: HD-GYP domain-containing protein [Clostridia bacterium]|nr:HD-GYP domain-containing protein [Clostridia bacterium]
MRAIPTSYIVEGSILAENLYTVDGRVLIKKGTVLNDNLKIKIETNRIFTVYIEDIHCKTEVNRLLDQGFRVKGALIVKELFDAAKKNEDIFDQHNALIKYAEDVLYEIRSYQKVQIEYVDIKNIDNYLYSSAINVAILSALIGWQLGLGSDAVKQLFLGAIYHDIGIALVPKNIIYKTEPLTLEEKKHILLHPLHGYNFLKDKNYISAYVKKIVLQHHEHIDGSGYPSQNTKDEIDKMSQIVGLADIYDAMTSDRPYRRATSPKEAIEYIHANKGKIFFLDVAEAFIDRITPYPRGTVVKMSNGMPAVVEKINDKWPLRPIIKLIYKTTSGYYYETIELMKRQNLLIEEVIYDTI